METKGKTQPDKILAAATDLLASGGAEALRVRDIAEAAGCSTMGVYSHFGGKDGLLDAMFVDGFERFTIALRDSSDGPTADRMSRIAHAYRSWALANPGAYLLMFAGAVPGFEPADASLAVAALSFDVLTDGIEAEQRAERIAAGDPVDIAWTLWGVVHGMVMLELTEMTPPASTTTPGPAFQAAIGAVMAGLGQTRRKTRNEPTAAVSTKRPDSSART